MNSMTRELESFLTGYRKEIGESAAALKGGEMPALREEDFALYEKSGNRLVYEGAYFSRRRFLAVLGLEAVLEKEETGAVDSTVLFQLCDVIEKVCAEETWALPAHVDRLQNPAWRETVELFASETAQTLSELLDRLAGFLPGKLKNRMEEEINRRVLEPYYLSEAPYAWWETGSNNWTAVCAGSIGSAVIHLSKAGRRLPIPLSACLERVCAAMPYYFQSFTDDGACMEGLQYYTYGMTYFANFAWELRKLTGENLFCRPDIAAFPARCFFPDGVSLSFSDGSSHDTFRVGLQALLALVYGDVEFPSMKRAAHLHSDSCYRFAGLKLDWFAVREFLLRRNAAKGDPMTPQPPYRFHILPSAQWCIGSALNGTGFACKGGHNGESHNHNDIGHLIYEADGVCFLTDLGAGEYDRDYFSKKRYQAVCCNSFGHSVPILNGRGQKEGEIYRCSAFSAREEERPRAKEGGQPDTQVKTLRAGIGVVRMEIGGAYSLSEDGMPLDGRAVLRQIRFDLDTGEVGVMDCFCFGNGADPGADAGVCAPGHAGADPGARTGPGIPVTVTENLVTQIVPVIEGRRVCLEQNGAVAVIEVEADPAAADPTVTVVEYDHRSHQGEAQKVYCIRWEVPLQDGKGTGGFTIRRVPDRFSEIK